MSRKGKRRQRQRQQVAQQVATPSTWPPGPWTSGQKAFCVALMTPGEDGKLPSPAEAVRKDNPTHTNPWMAAGRWLAMPHVKEFIRRRDLELAETMRFSREQAFRRYQRLLSEAFDEIARQKSAVFEAPSKDGPFTVGIGNPVPAIKAARELVNEMLKLTGQDQPSKLQLSGDKDKPVAVESAGGLSDKAIDQIKEVLGIPDIEGAEASP